MSLRRQATDKALPIWFVTAETWPQIRETLPPYVSLFAQASGFEPHAGRSLVYPGPSGAFEGVLFGLENKAAATADPFLPGRLVSLLPAGLYRFANAPHTPDLAALSWLLSSYRFTRYKSQGAELPELCAPEGVDADRVERIAEAVTLGRDLINTPANDLGPDSLEEAALQLATRYKAKSSIIRGEKLLQTNFPLIHAVGRASDKAPRLIDFAWGPTDAPKVTLVGKGVCFDSGGLDIKPGSAMLLMKKDMGGAATALALAAMIMDAQLPIRLRVLIPAVENAISGNAFRPGDIYPSRKGLTIEIGNTDAEGRLVLADALALADEEAPDLLIDFATLTGAARVALGPDLPPFYTGDDALADAITAHGTALADPVWRLPLWPPYAKLLDSKVADLNNVSSGSFAGSITAALFLQRFVEKAKAWVHFDLYAWTPSAKPGHPEGAEIQVGRLLFSLIEERFSLSSPSLTEALQNVPPQPPEPGPFADENAKDPTP
ncbi:leucyl aminopeptidase family protein [Beijerinckia indica]|uniref:Leucyl aminopeptidase n=1 Tax=Beijerinckia indica subsp. indica (strain ATCC 9039 / DSM 1715 / NCIMB 8712) TaxID=395963 RepID=B2IBH6_BEII9|nr:leucyl aminopeptidase family protein [Beijerinckia indica]ACB96602.1 Leucyl aminopeptidase [Beijerinckia indica subsp. indica ATCC 9039]